MLACLDFVGAGDWNSGPCVYTAGASQAQPSSQPWMLAFHVCSFFMFYFLFSAEGQSCFSSITSTSRAITSIL